MTATTAKSADVERTSQTCNRTEAGRILGLSKTGFHEIAYVEWGPADAERVVICVHGLTRQGRDFDHLAAHLAALGGRVICPDLVGRGRSGRLRDPQDYALPQYCSDMNALIAHSGAPRVDWVGTSLGGLIGLALAGLPGTHPIRRLVINDIGPVVPAAGLQRIGQYVAEMPDSFGSLERSRAILAEGSGPIRERSRTSTGGTWRRTASCWIRSDGALSHLVRSGDQCRRSRRRPIPRARTFGPTGMPSISPSWSSGDAIPTSCRPTLLRKWRVAIRECGCTKCPAADMRRH